MADSQSSASSNADAPATNGSGLKLSGFSLKLGAAKRGNEGGAKMQLDDDKEEGHRVVIGENSNVSAAALQK